MKFSLTSTIFSAISCFLLLSWPALGVSMPMIRLLENSSHWVDVQQPVETDQVLAGETTLIEINGLQPGQQYELETSSVAGTTLLKSKILFTASQDGRFITDRDSASSGSYVGMNPSGPLDSVVEASQVGPVERRTFVFRLLHNNVEVTRRETPFQTLRNGVREISLEGTGLIGKLYLPPADLGRRPIIINFGGSDAGYGSAETEAAYAANQGNVGLALAYFGAPGVSSELANVPIDDLFRRALGFIRTIPDIDSGNVILNGVSRGSELVILVGSLFPEVKAVIARSPSAYFWQSFPSNGFSPYTVSGQPVPFLSWPYVYSDMIVNGETVKIRLQSFLDALAGHTTQALERARLPIERVNGPVLLIAGGQDMLWPSVQWGQEMIRTMHEKKSRFAHQSKLIIIPDAGHQVARVPGYYSPPITIHPVTRQKIFMGGTLSANSHGMRVARAEVLTFVRNIEHDLGLPKPRRRSYGKSCERLFQ